MSQLVAAVVLTAVEVMCCVLFFRAFLNERMVSGKSGCKK